MTAIERAAAMLGDACRHLEHGERLLERMVPAAVYAEHHEAGRAFMEGYAGLLDALDRFATCGELLAASLAAHAATTPEPATAGAADA